MTIKLPEHAYPLQWPPGRMRTANPEKARFQTSLGLAIAGIREEVRLLGGKEVIITSNLPLRQDGFPSVRASGYMPDMGVTVYFTLRRKTLCFACDRWRGVENNMQAIAKTIAALRGIERWGSGQMVEQAFTGFTALPAPEQPWQTLELATSRPTREQVEEAHRRLAMRHHPDRGGDTHHMARINAAKDELLKRLASEEQQP